MRKMVQWIGSVVLGIMALVSFGFVSATTASAATLPSFNPKGLVPSSVHITSKQVVSLNAGTQAVVVVGTSKNSAGYTQGTYYIFTYDQKSHKYVTQYTGTGAETTYSMITGKLFGDSRNAVVIESHQANWGRTIVGAQIFGLSSPSSTTIKRFETTTAEVNATYQITDGGLIQTFMSIKHAYTFQNGSFTVSDVTDKPTVGVSDVVVYYTVDATGNVVTLNQSSVTLKVGQTLDLIRQDTNSAPSAVLLSAAPQSETLKAMVNDTENVQFTATQIGSVDLQIAPNLNLDNSPLFEVTVMN